MTEDFREDDKIKILLWCYRHCCLCGEPCGTNIVIHHIEQEGENLSDIENAIPLCSNCHQKIGSYNPKHSVGTKYKVKEIKARRDQIYEKFTRHLTPPIQFEITQVIRNIRRFNRKFPDVGFNLSHLGDSLPVRVKVEVKIILDEEFVAFVKDKHGYYSGRAFWNLNPQTIIFGHFNVPKQYLDGKKDLKIEVRITIIDQYDREHKYLPQCWTYVEKDNYWFLEPRSFTKWT